MSQPRESSGAQAESTATEGLFARVERLEDDLRDLRPSLRERLETVEEALKRGSVGERRLWPLLEKLVIPMVSGGVILMLGYWTKDSVNQALERQRVDLAYVKEMQPLLAKITGQDQPRAEKEAAALTLSAFGEPAVVPLVNLLQETGSLQALAARNGLRAVAFRNRDEVCRVLQHVLETPRRNHSWQLYLAVTELLGEQGCVEARGELEKLHRLLAVENPEHAMESLRHHAPGTPSPNRDSLRQLLTEVEAALASLSAESKRRSQ